MRFKKRYLFIALPLFLAGGYVTGPKAHFPEFDGQLPELTIEMRDLDSFLAKRESGAANLKPHNESRIVWADSVRQTPYSMVYLHGFSASPMEGHPVVPELAKRYGCNLYLPRLPDHGIYDIEVFKDLSPGDLINAAKEALAIGRIIGEKVILVSTSTGGTLSIYLTAQDPEHVEAQILFSPNIEIFNSMARLLTGPWGLSLARQLEGKYRKINYANKDIPKYWTDKYRTEGLVCLQYLLDKTMTKEHFRAVHQPLFVGCYYKNEEEQDQVVSVQAMRDFYETVSTPEEEKRFVEFPEAGSHVVLNPLHSKDIKGVREKTFQFVEEVLGLERVDEFY